MLLQRLTVIAQKRLEGKHLHLKSCIVVLNLHYCLYRDRCVSTQHSSSCLSQHVADSVSNVHVVPESGPEISSAV